MEDFFFSVELHSFWNQNQSVYSDLPHASIVLCAAPTGKKVNWEPEAVWRWGQRGRLSAKEHKNEKT